MSESIINEIQALQRMTVAQLRVRWTELYGEETRSRNRTYLWRRLAWRVQELQLGGLPDAAKARILDLAPATLSRPTMPPGFVPAPGERHMSPGPTTKRDPRLPAPGRSHACPPIGGQRIHPRQGPSGGHRRHRE